MDEEAENAGLVTIFDLMEILWPKETSRPSLQTVRLWTQSGKLPCIRIGRKVFYSVATVRARLEDQNGVNSRAGL